jgi:hypothetical protein
VSLPLAGIFAVNSPSLAEVAGENQDAARFRDTQTPPHETPAGILEVKGSRELIRASKGRELPGEAGDSVPKA